MRKLRRGPISGLDKPPMRRRIAQLTLVSSPGYRWPCVNEFRSRNGSRQSCAETCPARIQAIRVSSDPAIADIAAHFLIFVECLPLIRLATRNASGSGPDKIPPARVSPPLAPCFKGSSAELLRLSRCHPSQHSNTAAPSPSICSARLLRCPINSSNPTDAANPDIPK